MKEIYTSITNYYGEKIREHGATPRGVDWNGEESQHLRFKNSLTGTNERRFFNIRYRMWLWKLLKISITKL